MLILRSYQAHLGSFSDIVTEIQENLDVLSPSVKEMYSSLPNKKLVQRVREKFQRLMQNVQREADHEIREELVAIKALERDNVPVVSTAENPMASTSHEGNEKNPPEPEENDDDDDVRLMWARKIAKTIEEIPSKKHKRKKSTSKKSKRSSTRDLIRENEEIKNILLRDYLKKKMKKRNVVSSSSSSTSTSSSSTSSSDSDD